jgi:hypothetical protein
MRGLKRYVAREVYRTLIATRPEFVSGDREVLTDPA